jgi:hypothetical protein
MSALVHFAESVPGGFLADQHRARVGSCVGRVGARLVIVKGALGPTDAGRRQGSLLAETIGQRAAFFGLAAFLATGRAARR